MAGTMCHPVRQKCVTELARGTQIWHSFDCKGRFSANLTFAIDWADRGSRACRQVRISIDIGNRILLLFVSELA
jgi:hypothetical protein